MHILVTANGINLAFIEAGAAEFAVGRRTFLQHCESLSFQVEISKAVVVATFRLKEVYASVSIENRILAVVLERNDIPKPLGSLLIDIDQEDILSIIAVTADAENQTTLDVNDSTAMERTGRRN